MLLLVVNWLVTTVGLPTLAKLPLDLERTGIRTAALAAFLLGGRNPLFRPMVTYLTTSYQWIILGLLSIGLSSLLFWITPNLLDGFTLRGGFLSALISPIAVSILNSWLLWFLR
ncbi:MAG: phage holin family protein [Caldilineaceae bacterium]